MTKMDIINMGLINTDLTKQDTTSVATEETIIHVNMTKFLVL